MNLYARLPDIRRGVNLQSDHTAEDDRLLALAEQVSRAVDDYLGYPAYEREAEVYSHYTEPAGEWCMLRQPVVSVSAVHADTGAGWEPVPLADVVLEPEGADAIQRPFWRARLKRGAALGRWPARDGAVRVTGTAGIPCRRRETPLAITAGASDTVITVTGSPAGVLYPGDVIIAGQERMYIRSMVGSTITVARGINGTSAAAHTAAAVSIVEPPPVLTRAMLAWLGRLSWDELAGWQGSVMLTDAGAPAYGGRSSTPWSAVRALLSPYRRVAVA